MLPSTALRTASRRLALHSRALSTSAPRLSSNDGNVQLKAVETVGVLGAGQMGLGIALVAAKNADKKVVLVDNSEKSIEKGLSFLDKLLAKDVSKGRITTEIADAVRSKVTTSTDMGALSTVDFIIEAVPEIPDLKFKIFSDLARLCREDATLATNTSSISITRIAAAAGPAANRVLSTHFMNPVPIQKGVEVIRGLQTTDAHFERALGLIREMGKIPSESADTPGFLANRILMPYINEAIICLETGVGKKEDIDAIMKNGTNVPMGPLQLADFIGLDTCLAIMNVLYKDTGDSKYRPSVLLGRMVDAGWVGKKGGRGFYEY
ncbi:hypothetical protein BJ508DRAFT_412758 [Ascobolus immersus RN42]|uniref:3-hydroxybutyryl-CoA dehydrogenase n=1 Tax=Ascobolus immersus RN42 TaxID=1160509 RepID=A0A3N4IDZ0_ASCIM|nr:hypothetical protein BJ508DRAFT_412758 [Ascobolus immersus RN42]